VLVTGAAGAIGGALVRELARGDGTARFSLVDREPVSHALGARARTFAWDLSEPDALPAAWADATCDDPVTTLVNCAGFMELVSFAGTSWELGRALLDVDLVSPLRLMSLAVPSMRERGAGTIVNVSSMAGLVPIRGSSFYGAAKAGLAMASEVARIELATSGVHVLTVYPGPVASRLERRARAQVASTRAARAVPVGDPDALARAIAKAMRRRAPRVVYPPLYAGAAEVLSIARRFTERFSPVPRA